MKKVKLALIADTHVTEKSRHPSNRNFLKVLKNAAATMPHKVIILGDIAQQSGSLAIYKWFVSKLDACGLPYWIIPGNHDNPGLMKDVFKSKAIISDCRKTLHSHPFLFIDSSRGFIRPSQFKDLQSYVKIHPAKNHLLFTHYPPVRNNSGFIDLNFPLSNTAEAWHAIKSLPQIRHLFTGHYHHPRTVHEERLTLHVCPSTCMQVSPFSSDLKIEHEKPGWLYVEWDGRRLDSFMQYYL